MQKKYFNKATLIFFSTMVIIFHLIGCSGEKSTSTNDKDDSAVENSDKSVNSISNSDNANSSEISANSLEYVNIGQYDWGVKNLDVSTFKNGDPIKEIKSNDEWEQAIENKEPAWCYYENDPANNEMYGKIYNFYAVSDSRGLAPEGWRIPTSSDWEGLGSEKDPLITEEYWGGSNSTGLSLPPSGCRNESGSFNDLGVRGFWWADNGSKCFNIQSDYKYTDIDRGETFRKGFTVRCVRDAVDL